MKRLSRIVAVLVALLGAVSAASTQDKEWPSRPVMMVFPFAAGGNDSGLRLIAKALSEKFGQPFLVESRSGGGGAVASAQVARSAPDGYTLLLTYVGPAVLNKLLYSSISYDGEKDFEPIILLGDSPQVIIANPKLGLKTLGDLVAYGQSNPGRLTIGHAGAGTMGNLAAALFLARSGIEGSVVSYRGATPVVTDVLSGHIDAGFPVYLPAVETVTVLAVTSEQRLGVLPNVPTARESGVDVVASTWSAIVGPAGMPASIVEKLNGAINEYLRSEEAERHFAQSGLRILGGPPSRLTEVMARDREKWEPVIRAANIRLD